jgi:hypothetical protein
MTRDSTSLLHSRACGRSDAPKIPQKALPPDLRGQLAALADADHRTAALAIASLPFGYRLLLESYNLVSLIGDHGHPGQVRPTASQRYEITDAGWSVIKACSALRETSASSKDDLDLREDALQRKQLFDAMPFKLKKPR